MSMTKEEAITYLQEKYDYIKSFYDLAAHPEEDYPETAKYLQALQIVLSALRPITREQVEKVRGEWICIHPTNIFRTVVWKCSYCGFKDGEADWFEFCPACGQPKTEEAVEMVMERLEALK